jgi:hypothetical protein
LCPDPAWNIEEFGHVVREVKRHVKKAHHICQWKELLQAEPAVARALLPQPVRTIRSLTTRGYKFRTLAVNYRIQSEVLRLAHMVSWEGKSVRIAPALTRVGIANRISMHREAATRELNRYRSQI